MREYFKELSIDLKFKDFCKDNDADYFEGECGIWMMYKKIKYCSRAALRMHKDGGVDFGDVNEISRDFERNPGVYNCEEQKWIREVLLKLQKYKPEK